ncbi:MULTISPECIES: DUF6979 family protein [unclassified Polaribacter]|uniref:DUF6979 family protein n=1 Tax=unclassified Polaribacter TaxID=196858 RepID=UPI0011BD8B16|nr:MULTISPECIES: hypothetical protein [unclassified Polaribacter]TXD53640.1 hypothetical protein ES043_03180 [Polaribacter sp. IC063]TXD62120.1 hypothetical protein ES044_02525 [Polaribacter sp. IC066]
MFDLNKYGLTPLKNAQNFKELYSITEVYARAATAIFETKSSQEKSCPKNTFLGLCELGLVKGIPKGNYTKSVKNKEYALQAVEILKWAETKTFTPKELWAALNPGDKRSNSQMEVVLALWNEGLIVE